MTEKRRSGSWAIVYCPDQDSFLFGKRSGIANNPGKWNLFGGGIDPGESPRDSLLRELSEEAGLTPPANRLRRVASVTGAIIKSTGTSKPMRTLNYFRLIAGYELELLLNQEHCEYRWFRQAKLPKNVNQPTAIALHLGLFQIALAEYR